MTPFTLRPWKTDDLASLLRNAGNPNIARFMTDSFPHPYQEENGRAFIQFANSDQPVRIFCIDMEGEACGGIGIHPQSDIQRKNAELGYWLGEPFWGKGIMTRAIPMVVEFGFRNYDIERIFARPFGNNPASQKVLEKAGFTLEARIEKGFFKNGEFLDELIYAIRR